MDLLKTTGIVLSSRPFGEADILSTIYTKDYGKKKFIFKGLRKSKKRSRSATEPGAVSDLIYYYREERDSYIVNEFNVRKHYPTYLKDLPKIYALYFILESVDKTCGFNISDASIYELCRAALDTLAETPYPLHLSVFFVLHLLRIQGILSGLDQCKICGDTDLGNFTLDIIDLKPICQECLSGMQQKDMRRGSILNSSAREFIARGQKQKFRSINHDTYPDKSLKDLLFSISLFIENYFHTELKSKRFLLSD